MQTLSNPPLRRRRLVAYAGLTCQTKRRLNETGRRLAPCHPVRQDTIIMSRGWLRGGGCKARVKACPWCPAGGRDGRRHDGSTPPSKPWRGRKEKKRESG